MQLLAKALSASECVISVMGAHAGEGVDTIFSRKIGDCEAFGRTFWVAKSAKARPEQVQTLCASGPGYVIFVEPASPGGARPTTQAESAAEYSPDRVNWCSLPEGIGPVTGQMDDLAAALVFNALATDEDGTIDLWKYADRSDVSRPPKFTLGLSTICAVRKDTSEHPDRMKSRERRVVAVGRLTRPYCVWLR
jgi:hypothetical protein